jgi:hypothetical protein
MKTLFFSFVVLARLFGPTGPGCPGPSRLEIAVDPAPRVGEARADEVPCAGLIAFFGPRFKEADNDWLFAERFEVVEKLRPRISLDQQGVKEAGVTGW